MIGKLLAAGLDGEILLRPGDFRLAGVAVLGDEVTGKAGELVVIHHLDGAFAPGDRFAGTGKVMLRWISRLFTRGYATLYCLLESSPLAITQHRLQRTSAPVFGTVFVDLLQIFKRLSRKRYFIFPGHYFNSDSISGVAGDSVSLIFVLQCGQVMVGSVIYNFTYPQDYYPNAADLRPTNSQNQTKAAGGV